VNRLNSHTWLAFDNQLYTLFSAQPGWAVERTIERQWRLGFSDPGLSQTNPMQIKLQLMIGRTE
jgi:hypothetical protein